jgi:hypothetical protein
MPASFPISIEVEKPVDVFPNSFPSGILALREAPETIVDITFVQSLRRSRKDLGLALDKQVSATGGT